jgi:cytochrome d ubiquinol oxidase subunit I
VWTSLSAFILFYTALLVADVYLLVKYIRRGPIEPSEEGPGRTAVSGAPQPGAVMDSRRE